MKKIFSVAIEEIMLILYIVWVMKHFPEGIDKPNTLWIMGITTGIAVAASKTIEAVVDHRLLKGEKLPQRITQVKRWGLCFVLSSIIFFLAFNALKYFGNMPATVRLLIVLSIGATVCHLTISHVLDALMGLNRELLKDMFHEEYLEEIDDESEEL